MEGGGEVTLSPYNGKEGDEADKNLTFDRSIPKGGLPPGVSSEAWLQLLERLDLCLKEYKKEGKKLANQGVCWTIWTCLTGCVPLLPCCCYFHSKIDKRFKQLEEEAWQNLRKEVVLFNETFGPPRGLEMFLDLQEDSVLFGVAFSKSKYNPVIKIQWGTKGSSPDGAVQPVVIVVGQTGGDTQNGTHPNFVQQTPGPTVGGNGGDAQPAHTPSSPQPAPTAYGGYGGGQYGGGSYNNTATGHFPPRYESKPQLPPRYESKPPGF
uniref:Uncharacterized protein n=1 Tax=Chromera velia CCMP2878 TaxID=1169474 RepID=A0A0G4I270_9ALVE|eukprot:Cvel_10299.t1-p1 / transcript=Cvel_10299.t1 / gene=Cvel_10299 / organism=Chromera_velia_CCMP2878 / gene_product=hypothetical protein / transcript_product=hypothetical protein / location=Cvel_scaffold618:28964-29755(-) / protein_length=264 / sequence_SO=supercontig / SO=protein_coding / is_pseudo=false